VATPDIEELAEQARSGQAAFFLLFGGQGAGWLADLRGYYEDPVLRPVVEACVDAIDEELRFVDRETVLPLGWDVVSWLRDPARTPDSRYLSLASVSLPLIFVAQAACVRRFASRGLPESELLGATVGMSGQSQGLFPACMLALHGYAWEAEETLRTFAKYAFYIGARSQEHYPHLEPTEEELELAVAAAGDESVVPTPMAAVAGADVDDLEARLRRFNGKARPVDRVHISLRFGDDRVVLSGNRLALAEFHAQHATDFASRDIKFVYVRTSCPFHSVMMEGTRPALEADFARIGFTFPGQALAVPVHSCHDGRNLQTDRDVALTMHLDAVVRPLDWQAAVARAGTDAVTHVIDFGPGAETRHRTRRLLEARGCPRPVLSAKRLAAAPAHV
jgi:malonyl CoA-acyl carrier protein transacylase